MPRDPRKLRVFGLADDLVIDIYRVTREFPAEEKFGLTSQIRRAAVSIGANIAEGCGRRSTSDYLRFVSMANGSAYELGYLCGLSGRLGILKESQAVKFEKRSGQIAAALTALVQSLEHADDPEPGRRAKPQSPGRARTPERSRKEFAVSLDDLSKKRARLA